VYYHPERIPSAIEDAVKYIIFLVDADTLFDVALGMYDFSLVLLIAQHAQKVPYFHTDKWYGMLTSFQDPREYLPFLRELRALEKYYQRFRIDDHLKRYESALRNLTLAGLSISRRFILSLA
jgi:elongator complex protein 1